MKNAMRERARRYVGKHPLLFYGFYGLRPRHRDLLVNRTTQLVIEGFPRSGNTFAVVAFEQAQRESVRIAHHLHMPAQIMRAARWRIPALVLIRKPTDAALSLVMREPHISLYQALKYYVSFYETVARYRHAYVLGPFEEVAGDYGTVIERVNSRFGTRFSTFDHTEANVKEAFARIEESHKAKRKSLLVEEQIARPSATKDELKKALRREFEAPEIQPLVARAEAVYGDFAAAFERG